MAPYRGVRAGSGPEHAVGVVSRRREGGTAMSAVRICSVVLSLCVTLSAASSASAATVTFASTGAEQTFTVPSGVWSLHVVAVGGTGAATGRPGGRGAMVSADVSVIPGSRLYVEVGGNGNGGGTASAGFNGGAPGGNGCCGGVSNGGAGGGATDLRTAPRDQA